jgi:hypothetical protein
VTFLRRLILAVWTGGLLAVGGLVAPTLFSVLTDRTLAGRVAAELFTRVTLVSLVFAVCLAFATLIFDRSDGARRRAVYTMLPGVLLAGNEYLVRPTLQLVRAVSGGSSAVFAVWHSVSAGLYIVASLVVLGLLIVELRR